ncbi:MAG: replication protein [Arenicellales bacterium]
MASPQLDNGHTRIADELLDAIIRHPLTKRQYKILLAIIRKTYGFGKIEDDISSSQLAKLTGLTSAHCRGTLLELEKLDIVVARRGQYGKLMTLNKDYECWGVPCANKPKQDDPKQDSRCSETGRLPVPKQDTCPSQNGTHNKHSPINKPNTQPLQERRADYSCEAVEVSGGCLDESVSPLTRQLMPRHPLTPSLPKCELVFPAEFDDVQRQKAADLLSETGEHAQAILDVLQAAISAREIRKSSMAVLTGLIRRWRAGSFDPLPGLHIAERRLKYSAHKEILQQQVRSTEDILRDHARLLGVAEDEYLEQMAPS